MVACRLAKAVTTGPGADGASPAARTNAAGRRRLDAGCRPRVD